MRTQDSHLDNSNILTEQIKVLYKTVLPLMAVNLVVSSSLIYGLWEVSSRPLLTTWYVLIIVLILIRTTNYFFYYKRYFSEDTAYQYGLYFTIGSLISGLLWGLGAVAIFPDNHLEYQLYIIFVLVAMAAGSVSSLTIYLPVFLAYLPISLLPLFFKLVMMDDPIYISLGIMQLAYLLSLLYFGINFNRSLVQTLKLRFQNIDLVEQLRAQKNAAEQANQAKSHFLAAASHDLRQPLHSLSLFTSVLNERSQEPEVRHVVNKINASVDALQGLFNALLDISRLDAGVLTVEKSTFNLQALMTTLANDFDSQAKDKGLTITWPDVPMAVHTDPTLLEQILRNYLSNAIRYTQHGSIDVTYDIDNELVTILVADTGRGIPPDDQQSIFNEFYQLNNPERDRSKGLGLGLSIVQRTANLLGHSLGVVSTPGKGSTFSITLDRVTNKVEGELQQSCTDSLSNYADLLVLVIDDETDILEGTKAILEQWQCQVITAVDQDEAIMAIRQLGRKPDGIIADYRLRGNKSGITAIEAIHNEFDTNCPALIVTGDIAIDPLRDLNDSGYQMLHKPVAPIKLRTFLRHAQIHKKAKTLRFD